VTLLNRYILGIFLRLFLLSLGTFSGLFLLIDFFEKVDDFLEHSAPAILYCLYLINTIPVAVIQVVPMAILLAAFGTIGGLTRSNELTAMRGSGISIWRIILPLLGASLLITLIVMAVNEYLVPLNQRKISQIRYVELKGKKAADFKHDRIWFRDGNQIINVLLSLPEEGLLKGVTIYEFDADFRLIAKKESPTAEYGKGVWIFKDLTVYRFDPNSKTLVDTRKYPEQKLPLAKKPEDFAEPAYKTGQRGFFELRALIKKLQAEGYDARRYKVDMQARLTHPLACLVMAILGIPFALHKGRKASLALGVTFTIAIGIIYYILQAILMALGYSSVIPPFVAAWATLVLFTLWGIWLLLSARE